MDVAYNQHSPHSRRQNRSSTSLNTLSLAPLTSRFPIDDADEAHIPQHPRSPHHISYMETTSVPPAPGILSSSRSPSRSRSRPRRTLSTPSVPKSKSSSHIHIAPNTNLQPKLHRHKSGAVTPGPRPSHTHKHKANASEDFALGFFSPKARNEDDWLLRTGSLITSASRESKGQAWLVSRASSTSLTGQNDDDDTEDEAIPEYGFIGSRRASQDADDEFSPVTMRSFAAHSRSASRFASRAQSRVQSRVTSRRGSRSGLVLTPLQYQERDSYFQTDSVNFAKPDFVDVDEDLEAAADSQALQDELLVRRLAKTGTLGLGSWVERLMGWSLFAVEEDGEGEDTDGEGEETETTDTDGVGSNRREGRKERERQQWREMLEMEAKEQGVVLPPPPMGSDEGGWGDAAWLLSVATKVLL